MPSAKRKAQKWKFVKLISNSLGMFCALALCLNSVAKVLLKHTYITFNPSSAYNNALLYAINVFPEPAGPWTQTFGFELMYLNILACWSVSFLKVFSFSSNFAKYLGFFTNDINKPLPKYFCKNNGTENYFLFMEYYDFGSILNYIPKVWMK